FAGVEQGGIVAVAVGQWQGGKHPAGGGAAARGGVQGGAESGERRRPEQRAVGEGGERQGVGAGIGRGERHAVEVPEVERAAVGGVGLDGFRTVGDAVAVGVRRGGGG